MAEYIIKGDPGAEGHDGRALAADVVEVKHGRWTVLDECANAGAYCSVCHKKVYKECYGNCKMRSAYCPNCGAKMDLED